MGYQQRAQFRVVCRCLSFCGRSGWAEERGRDGGRNPDQGREGPQGLKGHEGQASGTLRTSREQGVAARPAEIVPSVPPVSLVASVPN